jgi:hypothetical protein
MSQWYVVRDNQPVGPLGKLEILHGVQTGEFNRSTLVCRVGASEWSPLGDDELLRAPSAPPPPPSGGPRPSGASQPWDVVATARNHRFMLMCLVGMLGSLLGIAFMVGMRSESASLFSIPYWICAIAAVVFACLTLSAMRVHVALIVVSAILLLAPCIGLITVLVISQVVQQRLRSAGLKVGFFGVSSDALKSRGYGGRF